MKIFPTRISITPNRRCVLNEHIRNFDRIITKGAYGKVQKFRNYIGLPLHATAIAQVLYDCFDGAGLVTALLGIKLNYDFVQLIRNINKRKAALFSEYLKSKGIDNLDEIRYAVKKYFVKLGMPFYPISHPKGMKQIVENGTYPKSFETGVFVARSDKKSFVERFLRKIEKSSDSPDFLENF